MQINTPRDIGALIKDRRSSLKLSQQDLAARVGVTRLWVVQLEKGKTTAQIGLVLRALKELGVLIDVSARPPTETKHHRPDAVDLDAIIHKANTGKP